ncbi:hypothetical protein EDC44_1181 [Cricetibacter osteomyelitidis]|uniref:Uncharacterized protein n=1 Tax=Cricetibacter osteomyelitidis TaxID=1521931 RepID=A0A4R2TFG4_9PAST|nr:hypothetical protein [Cricetibacter osteomyelitidis]TCP93452.1 hypothetical protein EDC44_1181 [Cricetibacter osteomyelitidis]
MKLKTIALLLPIMGLAACSDKTPNCSDERTKDVIADIMNDQLKERMSDDEYKRLAPHLKHNVTNIITKSHNEKLDNYICTGTWSAQLPEKEIEKLVNEAQEKNKQELAQYLAQREKEYNQTIARLDERLNTEIQEITQKFEKEKEEKIDRYKHELKTIEDREKNNKANYERNLKSGDYYYNKAKEPEAYNRHINNIEELYQQDKAQLNKEKEQLGKLEDLEEELNMSYQASGEYITGNIQKEKESELKRYNRDIQDAKERFSNTSSYRTQLENGFDRNIIYSIENTDGGKNFFVNVKYF